MVSKFLYIMAIICELTFVGSAAFIFFGGSADWTKEFCKKHKVIGTIWPSAALLGFLVFYIQLLQR